MYEPDEPDYMSAGIPDAETMARWLADVLDPAALSHLAARAISDFEEAAAGSVLEATLQLLSDTLSDTLHAKLEDDGDDYPAMLDERCSSCDDSTNVYTFRRNEMTGRCYDPSDGREVFTCQRCGFDLTPHLGLMAVPVDEVVDLEDDDLPW